MWGRDGIGRDVTRSPERDLQVASTRAMTGWEKWFTRLGLAMLKRRKRRAPSFGDSRAVSKCARFRLPSRLTPGPGTVQLMPGCNTPMGKILTDLSFEDWVRHLFDHPVNAPSMPEWYWDLEADSADLEPRQAIAHATRLFENAREVLAPYPDAQAGQGLCFLANAGHSHLVALANDTVPVADQVRCIRAMVTLFEKCFALRCPAHLSHLDRVDSPPAPPLNSPCYMWWDILPLCPQPENAGRREIDEACLWVMENTLQLPSIACQESALHGLGHWGLSYEVRCREIIQIYLERQPDIEPALRRYAEAASVSGVE